MRRERTILTRDSQRREGAFDFASKLLQEGTTFYARPKNAGMMRIREPAQAAHIDYDGCALGNAAQCAFELFEIFLGPLANEFQRNVQVVDGAPFDMSGGA